MAVRAVELDRAGRRRRRRGRRPRSPGSGRAGRGCRSATPMASTGARTRRHRRVGAAPPAAEVVQVHRLGEQQVGVGVEAAHELVAVVLEVALHLEALPQREPVERLDHLAAEAAGEDVVAAEGDLADHAGDRQRLVRTVAGRGVVVVAAPPARIHADDATAGRPPGDLLGAGGERGGDGHDRADPVGVHHGPLERPACRPSSRRPRCASGGCRGGRRARPALRTQSRTDTTGKRLPHGSPSSGCGLAGPVRALAAAEHVGAHDEPAVGVDGLARPDEPVPPAGRRMARRRAARRRGCRR